MANTRRRSQRGGSVNVQTATNAGTPVPNILRSNGRAPNKPSKRAVMGGRRGGKTRKASPWNLFVKKIFGEMKRKHGKGASFSDALKEASRRKKEM